MGAWLSKMGSGILVLYLSNCTWIEGQKAQTEVMSILSSSIGEISTVLVYYPTDYKASTPVIYLLNGWGTDASAWGSGVDLEQEADDRQCFFVSLSAGSHTYTNDPNNSTAAYEDYVLEVVRKVEQQYDLDLDHTQRALCGISNGGGGALYLLSAHPDRFVAAGSLSGTVYSSMDDYSGFTERGVRIDVGTSDTEVLSQCRWLHNRLADQDIEHTYLEHDGRHDWDFWASHASDQFDFLEEWLSH